MTQSGRYDSVGVALIRGPPMTKSLGRYRVICVPADNFIMLSSLFTSKVGSFAQPSFVVPRCTDYGMLSRLICSYYYITVLILRLLEDGQRTFEQFRENWTHMVFPLISSLGREAQRPSLS